jgi:inner-membrane translocator
MKKIVNLKNIIKIVAIIAIYILILTLLNGNILSRQYKSIVIPIIVNIILAVSLNLVTGFLGELSLGHAGFMSIGAYTGALISVYSKFPPLPTIIIAMLAGSTIAAVFGFIIGVPVLRLRGDYLAIVTLAFGEIIKSIINSIKFMGGAKGLTKIPLYTDYQNFWIAYICMIITIIFLLNLVKSRTGRAITAIRDNDIAAESVGINISKYKVTAFVIGAFFAGLAGVIYAHNVGLIKPTTFDYNKSIEILVIVVLGGMGSISGSIIAAIILTLLPEFLRGADNLRMLMYAIVLIIMMIVNNSKIKQGIMTNKTLSKLFKGFKEV